MDNYGSIYSMIHLLVQLHQVKMVLQLVDGQEASKQSVLWLDPATSFCACNCQEVGL